MMKDNSSLTSVDQSAAPSVHCERCGGEGKLYTSRYGGNDPDVWPTGTCPVCEGTGYTPITDGAEPDTAKVRAPQSSKAEGA